MFRFWWQIRSHTNYPTTLRVAGGHSGCQAFWTCWWTVSSRGSQPRRERVHQLWGYIVQTEWEAAVNPQSQDQGSVWQLLRRTGQHRTTTCPQQDHRPTRSAIVSLLLFCTLCLKKVLTFKLSVTLSNIYRFSKFVHCWKAYEICYKKLALCPTKRLVCCYTTLENQRSKFVENCRRRNSKIVPYVIKMKYHMLCG